jgi:hypothetical protein
MKKAMCIVFFVPAVVAFVVLGVLANMIETHR